MKGIVSVLFVLAWAVSVYGQAVKAETESPLIINATAPTNTVRSGHAVKLSVKMTNLSDRQLTVSMARSQGLDISYNYDVRGPDGEERTANQNTGKVVGHVLNRVLQPGESTGYEPIDLSRAYDMTEPGQYSIQVSRHVSQDGRNVTVRSNIVVVTIAPDE